MDDTDVRICRACFLETGNFALVTYAGAPFGGVPVHPKCVADFYSRVDQGRISYYEERLNAGQDAVGSMEVEMLDKLTGRLNQPLETTDIRKRVEELFQQEGVNIVDDRKELHPPFLFRRNDKLLIRNPVLFEARGEPYRAHFLFKDYANDRDVVIVAREQKGSGTADEKLVGHVESMAKSQYASAWLILSGQGFSRKARIQVDEKVIEVSRGNRRVRVINDLSNLLDRAIKALVTEGTA